MGRGKGWWRRQREGDVMVGKESRLQGVTTLHTCFWHDACNKCYVRSLQQ